LRAWKNPNDEFPKIEITSNVSIFELRISDFNSGIRGRTCTG